MRHLPCTPPGGAGIGIGIGIGNGNGIGTVISYGVGVSITTRYLSAQPSRLTPQLRQ